MTEVYLGPIEDRRYIASYLSNIRQLDPIEIATLPQSIPLSNPDLTASINLDHLWSIVGQVLADCEEHFGVRIATLSPDRYYTAPPVDASDIGGFYCSHSIGYQYWYQSAFVVSLNCRIIKSIHLRTVELARNVLHDSFHYSTFKSFRRVIRTPAVSVSAAKHRVPEVYREQYGINFRNENGVSYSSRDLTNHSPKTINLNLLMDGVIVLIIGKLLRTEASSIVATTEVEQELVNEMCLDPIGRHILPVAHAFHGEVTGPSRDFIEHWGGTEFVRLVLGAMIDGDLRPLKQLFSNRLSIADAWEKTFRRPDFSVAADPSI